MQIRITSGPAIEKPGDLAALLTNLQEGDVLFIDEIHRLSRQVEEVLYPALEDYALDIMIGKGPQRPEHPDQPAPLHAGGRYHPCGPDHRPPAGPLRCAAQAGLYSPDELSPDHPTLGGHPRQPITGERLTRLAKCGQGTPRGKPLLEACPRLCHRAGDGIIDRDVS